MTEHPQREAAVEMRAALNALFIAVPEDVAFDVRNKVFAYTEALSAENERLAERVRELETGEMELLGWLEHESYDLRCVDVPTGGDDYDIDWIVISHHMSVPHEREEGRGKTPQEAIENAKQTAEQSEE
jgi:hypothetical protein